MTGRLFIFFGTLTFGSCYPIVIAWTKQGQDHYPFMFSTALLMAKIFMLFFYSLNLWWEKSMTTPHVYSEVSTKESVTLPTEPVPDTWGKLKLSIWALPNIVFTLVCDVLTFQAMKYISVASYSLIVQTTTLWIVVAQFIFLRKTISCPQSLAITLVTMGVVGFQLIELENKNDGQDSAEEVSNYHVMLGIGLVAFRGFLKACNMVYCEWFLQHGLKHLSFYEKQVAISFWFVISSSGLVLQSSGSEIFSGRPFFDGYSFSTWVYISLAAALGIWYYLLVKHLDALMMGICSMCTLPCTVFLDMMLFGTNLSRPQIIFAATICLGSFQYNLLKQYMPVTQT